MHMKFYKVTYSKGVVSASCTRGWRVDNSGEFFVNNGGDRLCKCDLGCYRGDYRISTYCRRGDIDHTKRAILTQAKSVWLGRLEEAELELGYLR